MNRRTVMLVVAILLVALGGGLLYVWVSQAEKRADERYDAVKVLKVVEVIPAGESIETAMQASKIQPVSISKQDKLPTALTETTSLAGLVATTTLFPGEQVIPEKFGGQAQSAVLPIPDDKVAVSAQLTDPGRVAGFVQSGSEVAVFVTLAKAEDQAQQAPQGGNSVDTPTVTVLLFKRVPVIGVGSTTVTTSTTTTETADGAAATTTEQLPRTLLTLGLELEEAQQLIHADSAGELSFALLTDTSKTPSVQNLNAVRTAS